MFFTTKFKPINGTTAKTQSEKPTSPKSPSSNGLRTPSNSEVDFASAPSSKGSPSTSLHSVERSSSTAVLDSGNHQLQDITAAEMQLANISISDGQQSPTRGPVNEDFGSIGQERTRSLTSTSDADSTGKEDNTFGSTVSSKFIYGRRFAIDFGSQGNALGSSPRSPPPPNPLRQPFTPGRNTPWPQQPSTHTSSSGSRFGAPAVFTPESNHSSGANTTVFGSPSPLVRHGPRVLFPRAPHTSPVRQALEHEAARLTTPIIPNSADPTHTNNETFRPMHTVEVRSYACGNMLQFGSIDSTRRHQPSPFQAINNIMNGFSPNYQGDTTLANNRSANIPESESCSLFILGLPPTLTTKQLLGAIRNTGRVWASHINMPEPSRGHTTCAAKVIFFERDAARRFHAATQPHNGGFVTDPSSILPPARVLWNRIRSAEVGPPTAAGGGGAQGSAGGSKSRVLLIYGPRRLVNEASLTAYFASKMEFQIDEAFELASCVDPVANEVMVLFEYRFGSFRCQAEAAKMSLSREFRDEVKVWYGEDPCAPGVVGPEPAPCRGRVALWPDHLQVPQSRALNLQF